jgi:DNA mismatch repair protein MutS
LLFLRKLKQGGSIHSFGIDVAKMAGIPKNVILQARCILNQLEKMKQNTADFQVTVTPEKTEDFLNTETMFSKNLYRELSDLDINNLTPLLALSILEEMQKKYVLENFFFNKK